MPKAYRCAMCKEIFINGWTEEEAVAEMKANLGQSFTPADCNVVCDDCYQTINPAYHPEMAEEAAKSQAASNG